MARIDRNFAHSGEPAARETSLVYCIGAAKCGTTWLHQTLATSPGACFSPLKEMHYFNLRGRKCRWERRAAFIAEARARRRNGLIAMARDLIFRRRLRQDEQVWIDVFGGGDADVADYLAFLRRPLRRAGVIADFTPTYATLTAKDFRLMAGLVERPRFLFIMRDPIDRAWSQIRMVARHKALKGEDFAETTHRLCHGFIAGEGGVPRNCDFSRTIQALRRAAPSEAVRIDFYEELFSTETVSSICSFVGLGSPRRIVIDRSINPGVSVSLDAGVERAFFERLKSQYIFVHEMFGDMLPRRWRERMEAFA